MDYIAGIILLGSMYLTGKKKWYGWVLSVVGNIIWLYIGLATRMGGLWTISVIMIVIGIINMVKWYKKRNIITQV